MRRAKRWLGRFAGMLALAQPVLACAMSCNLLAASRFNFGDYDPLAPLPLDVQATYTLQCIPDHPHEKLRLKITALSPAQSSSLQGPVPGKFVRFGMYLDPGRQIPLDGRTLFDLSDRISTVTEYPVTVYGRMPAKQNIPAGSYRTSITFVIEY